MACTVAQHVKRLLPDDVVKLIASYMYMKYKPMRQRIQIAHNRYVMADYACDYIRAHMLDFVRLEEPPRWIETSEGAVVTTLHGWQGYLEVLEQAEMHARKWLRIVESQQKALFDRYGIRFEFV